MDGRGKAGEVRQQGKTNPAKPRQVKSQAAEPNAKGQGSQRSQGFQDAKIQGPRVLNGPKGSKKSERVEMGPKGSKIQKFKTFTYQRDETHKERK